MKHTLTWNYTDTFVDPHDLKPLTEKLASYNEVILTHLNKQYQTPYGFLQLPQDQALIEHIKTLVQQKKDHGLNALIIIGIGGSHLGTYAIHQALGGIFYNELDDIKCYFFDTIEDLYTQQLLALTEKLLQKGDNPLIVIISKSGTTLETLTNAALCLTLLQKYRPHTFAEHLTIITDEDSPLAQIAQNHNISLLTIPKPIGGRFSVLSAVGLFPLSFLEYDIDALQYGAQKVMNHFPSNEYAQNAAFMAALLFYYLEKGKTIFDTFVDGPSITALGYWYRQLMGESLGKQQKAFTPTVSVATNDLHSVLQLYLGGPRNKLTLFLSATYQDTLVIPSTIFSSEKSVSVAHLQQAIQKGVFSSYASYEQPFISYHFETVGEEALGTFMYMRMLEIIYLSFLMNVDPFDQPHVELYKQETKKYV